MTRPNRLLTTALLAGLGWAAAANGSKAANGKHHTHTHTRTHAHAHARGARQPRAPAHVPSASGPAPPTENLVVHGQRRFTAAPVPNQEIHDPADALRDPNTGAPIGRFGRAFMDANPVPPVNPGLKGDESPVMVGIQR